MNSDCCSLIITILDIIRRKVQRGDLKAIQSAVEKTPTNQSISLHISWSLSQSVPVIVIVMLLFMFTNTLLMLLLKLRGHHPLPPLACYYCYFWYSTFVLPFSPFTNLPSPFSSCITENQERNNKKLCNLIISYQILAT